MLASPNDAYFVELDVSNAEQARVGRLFIIWIKMCRYVVLNEELKQGLRTVQAKVSLKRRTVGSASVSASSGKGEEIVMVKIVGNVGTFQPKVKSICQSSNRSARKGKNLLQI